MKTCSATHVAGIAFLCLLFLFLQVLPAHCDVPVASPGVAGPGQAVPTRPVRLLRGPDRVAEISDPAGGAAALPDGLGSASQYQAKPDLTVVSTWTVPETFCRHAIVDIHSTIENIGTVAVGDSFYFDMWFDGEHIGYARIGDLGAGESLDLVLESFAWPGDTLYHAVTAMADTDHEIDEELEVNNIHLQNLAADVCTTCTFVNVPFETGWNWFSLNVYGEDMSLDHVLASLDSNGVYIKSQTAFAEYVPAWNGWFGTLTSISCRETYLIKMGGPDTLDFCGFPYEASTPLDLPPGWSWISFLPQCTMTVDEALGSLGSSGEYIKNQTAFAEYVPAWNGWFGTLVEMCPCDGYKIRMAAADALLYPDSVEVTGSMTAGRRAEAFVGGDPDAWTVSPHDFEATGSVTAEVLMNGLPCIGPGDCLGAFSEGECRGVTEAVIDPGGRFVFYLTVYGGGGVGETLRFRYFDSTTGLTYDIGEGMEFRPDVIAGGAKRPFCLHASQLPARDSVPGAALYGLGNSPDPFTGSTVIRFRLGRPATVRAGIYDVRGKKVVTLWDGYLPADTHTLIWDGTGESGQPVPGGVYFCRTALADEVLVDKMVLMK